MAENFTPEQRLCIESSDRRLAISAAAGTGKTFTLTRKIAWMMSHGMLDSIEQVLAITFTKKAASEIKARVRSTLRAHGMHSEALLVDGAWISTIHSMCARILREHPVELGVDPSFEIAQDPDDTEILAQSIEDVLREPPNEQVAQAIEVAFDQFPAKGTGGLGSSGTGASSSTGAAFGVSGMIAQLVGKAALLDDGFDSISTGPAPLAPADALRRLLTSLEAHMGIYEASECKGKTFCDGLEQRRALVGALSGLLERGDDLAGEELADVLEAYESLRKANAKHYPEVVEGFLEDICRVGEAAAQLIGAKASEVMAAVLAIAREVDAVYRARKAERGVVTNDDLLATTRRALREHPEIAEEYRRRFKLVMVDEFQDTSQAQIDIIEMLTGPTAQLCTIGDAQQSIYGFRGADVSVYESFVDGLGAEPVELGLNFRSHADILAAANKLFEAPSVFGKRFLRLRPGRQEKAPAGGGEGAADASAGAGGGEGAAGASAGVGEAVSRGGFCGEPRVRLVAVQSAPRQAKAADRRAYLASAIAKAFASYRDAGQKASDMVVLLGSMSNSQIYSDALSAEGFDVVIAGGSGFWETRECKLVSYMLRVLANRNDSEAIFGLARSGFVPLGDDDLVRLTLRDGRCIGLPRGLALAGACEADQPQAEACRRRRSCPDAAPSDAAPSDAARSNKSNGCGSSALNDAPMEACRRRRSCPDAAPSDALRLFARLIDDAAGMLTKMPIHRVLEIMLADSGYVERLVGRGSAGTAAAANVLKAIRHVRSMEESGLGIVQVASAFSANIAAKLKEGPGTLMSENGDAVRIMTIHASKGLEFPIVALAEFSVRSSGRPFSLQTRRGRAFATLNPRVYADDHKNLVKLRGYAEAILAASAAEEGVVFTPERLDACVDCMEFHMGVSRFGDAEELGEGRRKFYVGVTRASEALLIGMQLEVPAKGIRRDSIEHDVASALFGSNTLPGEDGEVPCEAGSPLGYVSVRMGRNDDGEAVALSHPEFAPGEPPAPDESAMLPPMTGPIVPQISVAAVEGRERLFSYSSIASGHPLPYAWGAEGVEPADEIEAGRAGSAGDEFSDDDLFAVADLVGDEDSSTELGLAFHCVAERMALSGAFDGHGNVQALSEVVVRQIARSFRVSEAQYERLLRAVRAWASSDVAAFAAQYPILSPEVPFCMPFQVGVEPDPGPPLLINGEIDLLACDADRKAAFVVDYKTGGSDDEAPEHLRAKHELQSMCYAYALLTSGFEKARLVFVRVERIGADGQPQTVVYDYAPGDLGRIRAAISQARGRV